MVDCVVGGQFGSEGKGKVCAFIAKEYSIHVRSGASNAGHTFYLGEDKFVMQVLPCAAYASPSSKVCLGSGSVISKDLLEEEIKANQKWRTENNYPALHVLVDKNAHVIQEKHKQKEREKDLQARISSTSAFKNQGIGECEVSRVRREKDCLRAENVQWPKEVEVLDLSEYLMDNKKETILLEGTQGTSLSLYHGIFPFVTSRDTSAASLLAACNAGSKLHKSILVVRSFPIRVWGNSGPFFKDSEEKNWQELGLLPELTTVTGKERRVATISIQEIKRNAYLNSATEIVFNFADYLDQDIYNKTSVDDIRKPVLEQIKEIEKETSLPVTLVGTGPKTFIKRKY